MADETETSFRGALEELAFAYDQVPFYREHLDRAGVAPGAVRAPADLLQVPATTKRDYRRHFPARVLARGRHLGEPGVFTVSTSGTTDERLITAHHAGLANRRLFGTMRLNAAVWRTLRAATPRRYAMYAPPQCTAVDCANPDAGMEARLMPSGRLALPTTADFLLAPGGMLDQAARELDAFRPVMLDGDPFRISHLVRHLRRTGGAPLAVGVVALGFCQTTPGDRRVIRAGVTGATVVVETVGMSEFGKIAAECEHGGLHLNTGTFYPELVAGGRHAAPGELAELYLTTIGDRLAPHVRYRTGDLYTLVGGACPCGARAPLVRFEGRKTSVLVLADGRLLTPREVAEALAALPLRLYQLEQRERERFAFSYLPEDGAAVDAAAVQAAVRALVGAGVRLDVAARDAIASSQSGKFLTCRSAAGAPPAWA
ncbi:MAG TPA: hypothetical protein VGQ83_11915 [Polyangia bacterium]|jgi:phenylacetate-CoA ligase